MNFKFGLILFFITAQFALADQMNLGEIEARRREADMKAREAKNAPTCKNANLKFEQYMTTLPYDCKIDSDCKPQFLNLDSCVSPYLVNKKYEARKDAKLRTLQAEVRKNCAAEYSARPPCAPQNLFPVCHKNKCIPKQMMPVAIMDESLTKKYQFATMRYGCAPHDGPSWTIHFTTRRVKCEEIFFPNIGINWWGEQPTLPLKKPFRIYTSDGDRSSISFCQKKGSCLSGHKIELELRALDRYRGNGALHMTMPDGRKLDSDFSIEICQGTKTPCG